MNSSVGAPPVLIVVSRCAWTLYSFRGNLLRVARREGYRVLAVGDGRDGYANRIRDEFGVEFRHVEISARGLNPLANLLLAARLWRLFRRHPGCTVHLFTIKPVIFGGIALSLCRNVVGIATVTGLGYAFTEARPFVRSIASLLYRYALRHVRWTFFQNPDDRKLFLEARLVSPARSSLIAGSGVDVMRFSSDAHPAGPHDAIRVLFVGRLLRDKGVFDYLEAARIVTGNRSNVQFGLLGDIDERNPTSMSRSAAELLERENGIDWYGRVDDVVPYLAASDIVVLPSYREGTPRSLLEAAAMGKALVATDVPGCREVVEDGVNGILVPVKSPRRLAAAVERLVNDASLRRSMGRAGRKMVETRFDERKVIATTLAKYSELQAGNSA